MSKPTSHANATQRRAFSLPDLFWIIFIIALLISILLPSLSRAREISKRAVCASNLRCIGQGCKIYANDNYDYYPHHYFEVNEDASGPLPDHGVTWVGTMGSNEALRISERTAPDKSPRASHPSRSLFMLIMDGTCTCKQFICPSSRDKDDDLRNRGPDADRPGGAVASMPGINRFDFRGYTSISYGYQLPYGPKARPTEYLDTRMVVMADKGPYYEAGGEGLPGTETVRDRLSFISPPNGHSAEELLRWTPDQWRPHNSRMHRGEGQNVQYADGHVVFEKKPCISVNFDNIYTIQRNHTLADTMMGKVPGAHETIGPFTNTDSFIVP